MNTTSATTKVTIETLNENSHTHITCVVGDGEIKTKNMHVYASNGSVAGVITSTGGVNIVIR